jgi:DNA-directed RNA polymerase specialized sigma24 family protein
MFMESIAVWAISASSNETAYRALTKDKYEVERRLQRWGEWTRTKEQGGYPTRSVHTKVNEGGVMAGSPRPPTELPPDVCEVDRVIARLPQEWQRAARSNWQYGELPQEDRAARIGIPLRRFRHRLEGVRREVRRVLNL